MRTAKFVPSSSASARHSKSARSASSRAALCRRPAASYRLASRRAITESLSASMTGLRGVDSGSSFVAGTIFPSASFAAQDAADSSTCLQDRTINPRRRVASRMPGCRPFNQTSQSLVKASTGSMGVTSYFLVPTCSPRKPQTVKRISKARSSAP